MNSHILITKRWYIPFFSNRRASRDNFRLGYQQTSIFCVLLIWLLWVYNVYSYNKSSTISYEISEISKQNRDLKSKLERMQVVVADYESSDNIETAWNNMGMVAAGTPIYIEPITELDL